MASDLLCVPGMVHMSQQQVEQVPQELQIEGAPIFCGEQAALRSLGRARPIVARANIINVVAILDWQVSKSSDSS